MTGFLGSFQHQIDEKGRLSLPAQFRRGAEDRPLVLAHVQPDALSLYPEAAWAEVEERMRDMLRRNPQARAAVLRVTSRAVEVVPDRQGRILVPRHLQDAVGIAGPTLVVGMLDRIELWNPDRFAETTGATSPEEERVLQQIFA